MDAREQRGLLIAATQKITNNGKLWLVPSQSGKGRYGVTIDGKTPFCTCPDFETTGKSCKHVFAVQYTIAREKTPDGSIVETETMTVVKKTTYRQDWPAYNAAQVNEREHFLDLLAELCETAQEPERKATGRKPIPLRDSLFAACLKVYSLMSARRFQGDLQDAFDNGYISKLPCYNSVLNVFNEESVTPILKAMIERSALPLAAIETTFAADSTGFATSRYVKWFDEKYGTVRQKAMWVKAHVAIGTKTNVITAVEILEQASADSPQFPALVNDTAKGFTIGEFSADKAYASNANFETVEKHGGRFFPMFKENTTGGVGGSFEKAYHTFCLHREEYLKHYHQRSNVESTFSMVKRKFGDSVRSKTDVAMKNEVLAKFVCHNVCVLIAEMYALGIDPSFGRKSEVTACQKTIRLAQKLCP